MNQLDRMNHELRMMIQRLAVAAEESTDAGLAEDCRARAIELSEGLDATITLREWVRMTEGL